MADLGLIEDLWFDRTELEENEPSLADIIKASFSGDRSAAGRYAAEQRWKDHAKENAVSTKTVNDKKFKEKYGNERMTGDGDCFESAVSTLFDELKPKYGDKAKICQGVPMGQGPIEGIRFDHAWCEVEIDDDVMVVDTSNGRRIEIPQKVYYIIGKIDSADVHRYTAREALKKMNETGVYGPWA